MPLPRKVERPQWVNRYYRFKVLLNVAKKETSSRLTKPKLVREGKALELRNICPKAPYRSFLTFFKGVLVNV
jgi:hypothetical protein